MKLKFTFFRFRLFLYFFATLLFLIFFTQNSYADCVGDGHGIWTTDGNEHADITECIVAAADGDTINVIAGDNETIFPTPIIINKSVKIIGPGKNSLIIRWTGSYAFSATNVSNWRISGFDFHPDVPMNYAILANGGAGWRIDHNRHTGMASATTHICNVSVSNTQDVNGLIDSNELINGRVGYGNSAAGDQAIWASLWFRDLKLGQDLGSDAVYIEDNIFTVNSASLSTNAVDANRGARYVFRYNTVYGSYAMVHGFQDVGRGTRSWEVYGNYFEDTIPASWSAANYMRAGTGVIHNNKYVNHAVNIYLQDDRSNYGESLRPNSDNLSAEGKCDGDNINDGNATNPDTGYIDGWPCRDQIGRSKDATLWTHVTYKSGNTIKEGTAGPVQESAPAYFWSVYTGNGAVVKATVASDTNKSWDNYVSNLSAAHMKTNRDFYDYNPFFTGTGVVVGNNNTGGVGCGTLAARPTACSTGVAFWATSQSCSDLTGKTGPNPAAPISGMLYKCTAPNTWTKYYEPYVYPHPLRALTSDVDTMPPASPTNLKIT